MHDAINFRICTTSSLFHSLLIRDDVIGWCHRILVVVVDLLGSFFSYRPIQFIWMQCGKMNAIIHTFWTKISCSHSSRWCFRFLAFSTRNFDFKKKIKYFNTVWWNALDVCNIQTAYLWVCDVAHSVYTYSYIYSACHLFLGTFRANPGNYFKNLSARRWAIDLNNCFWTHTYLIAFEVTLSQDYFDF